VLRRCTTIEWDGAVRPLSGGLSTASTEAGDVMAAEGLRVLAVATRAVPGPYPAQQLAESGLTLLGLVGMVDPPRVEVAGAVRACQRAGIRIVMVSGDHPLTVEAVARHLTPDQTYGNGETLLVRSRLPAYLTGRPLAELDIDGEVRVVEVSRGGRSFIPGQTATAAADDLITFAVAAGALGRLRANLDRELGT